MSARACHHRAWARGLRTAAAGIPGNIHIAARVSRDAVGARAAHPLESLQSTSALEALKERLLEQALFETDDPSLRAWLRLAADEAASLAWATSLPLLFMPGLFEEKAAAYRRYLEHQRLVDQRSRAILLGIGFVQTEPKPSPRVVGREMARLDAPTRT